LFTYIKNKYNKNPQWVLEGEKKNSAGITCDIEFSVAPYLILPKTIKDFYGMHKRKFWYNIKRAEKMFATDFGELKFIVTSERDLLLQYLPKIQELFAARWKDGYTSFDWKTKEGFLKYQEAMLDFASTGNGEVALLFHKQMVLAFGYMLIQEGNYYFFQHAVITDSNYRKYSLGKILIKKLIERAINNNLKTFDFMTGDQRYKREWSNGEKKVYYRLVENKNVLGVLKLIFKAVIYKGRSFIHRNKRLEIFVKKIISLIYK
jgi:hypothetical protein